MRFACWITKATKYTLRIWKALPRQQWLHQRASLLPFYVRCLPCCLWSSDLFIQLLWSTPSFFLTYILLILILTLTLTLTLILILKLMEYEQLLYNDSFSHHEILGFVFCFLIISNQTVLHLLCFLIQI